MIADQSTSRTLAPEGDSASAVRRSSPANTLVRIKLTADTEFPAQTVITVHLSSNEDVITQITNANCTELDLPLRREMEETLDIVEPMPSE